MKIKKISKLQLRRIIKEELRNVLEEAQKKTIQREVAPGRNGPGSYHDIVVNIKKGEAVEILDDKTKTPWIKVAYKGRKVWIHMNTLSKAKKRKYKAVDPKKTVDVSSSPAGLASAGKG